MTSCRDYPVITIREFFETHMRILQDTEGENPELCAVGESRFNDEIRCTAICKTTGNRCKREKMQEVITRVTEQGTVREIIYSPWCSIHKPYCTGKIGQYTSSPEDINVNYWKCDAIHGFIGRTINEGIRDVLTQNTRAGFPINYKCILKGIFRHFYNIGDSYPYNSVVKVYIAAVILYKMRQFRADLCYTNNLDQGHRHEILLMESIALAFRNRNNVDLTRYTPTDPINLENLIERLDNPNDRNFYYNAWKVGSRYYPSPIYDISNMIHSVELYLQDYTQIKYQQECLQERQQQRQPRYRDLDAPQDDDDSSRRDYGGGVRDRERERESSFVSVQPIPFSMV